MTARDVTERAAWLALATVPGVGEHLLSRLVGHYGGSANVLAAGASGQLARDRQVGRLGALAPEVPARIAAVTPDAAESLLERHRLWALTPLDAGYPSRLRVLDPPPAVLYGWGDPAALVTPRAVALVGTRRPTPGGRAFAARLAIALSKQGCVVVSGLAVGIDGAAHAAAVENDGATVGVIGAGHVHPGPRAHRRLVAGILATGGAVVSELHPEAVPTRGTFPRRNRIISALADATVVVEAPLRSGALITARHALEQGRAVFAVPGRPSDVTAAGCLALLRETPARPVVGVTALVEDLGLLDPPRVTGDDRGLAVPRAVALLSDAERTVAERLARAPSTADRIVADTGLPATEVAAALTLLQLRGWARPSGATFLPAGPLLGG